MAAPTMARAGACELSDRTSDPRFGLKGPGTTAWLAARSLALPELNRAGRASEGIRMLRLGREEVLLLAGEASDALAALVSDWQAADGLKGYRSWREEGWAWMRLAAPGHPRRLAEVMAGLCAVDLRPGRIAPDAVIQTRFAGLETVIAPSPGADGFDLFFDVASKAYAKRAVALVAEGVQDAAAIAEPAS